ncbi:hypothetical protein QZM19_22230 [Burkholderia multivorans]|uniref:hypothetical protein n=1 Tax=Burkholderia multivorans TaxID=87883 RepID=UPI00050EC360|nr:hypothetical protein [Burkholderia multivorans]KGB90924.1 hypothetical protein DM81_525 [Burkholderia multivorans]MDN7866098.1 hypothetical protein [Burkholderia multivorans]
MRRNRNDYVQRREAAIAAARLAFADQEKWRPLITGLAAWTSWLCGLEWSDECQLWIPEALASTDRNLEAWGRATNQVIDFELAELVKRTNSAEGGQKSLISDVAYLIGLGVAQSFSGRITESRGFSLPYELVAQLDTLHVGIAAVGDALSALPEETWQAVKKEILQGLGSDGETRPEQAHIASLRRNDVSRMWEQARDAEQAVDRAVLDTWSRSMLHCMLPDAGRRDLDFYAKALDSTAGPWVTWFVISNARHTYQDVISLLEHAETCYEADGKWTKRWTGRLLVHLLEQDLLSDWRESEVTDTDARQGALSKVVSSLFDVLQKSVGGRVLAVRWLAHLIMHASSAEMPTRGIRRNEDLQLFYYAVLNAVIDSVAGADWSHPASVRGFFPLENSGASSSNKKLPTWIDDRGRADYAVPLACATALRISQAHERGSHTEFDDWFRDVMVSLRDKPAIYYLAAEQANLLTRLLAWPLCISANSQELLDQTWQQIALVRVEASYGTDVQTMNATNHCAAVAHVALEALSWGRLSPGEVAAEENYPDAVADIVDELRYFVPAVGLKTWTSTIGRLASVMAATKWFSQDRTLSRFIARYKGDIDSLAVVSASAIANGIPSLDVAKALEESQVSATVMVQDYREWFTSVETGAAGNQVINILEQAYGQG